MSHARSHSTPAEIVRNVAVRDGIPPRVALAIAKVESGLDPYRVGDNGTSFGLYQLHIGGELGNHTEQWAFNPRNNAETALSRVAAVRRQHPNWSWGQVAAAAQRPADQASYARAVDSQLHGKLSLPEIANIRLSALSQPSVNASSGTSIVLLLWVVGFILVVVLLARRR